MSAFRLRALPYDRALPRPLVTAHGIYENRRGVILVLDHESGMRGLGDAAPLPGFSRETIEDVNAAIDPLGRWTSDTAFDIPETPNQLVALSETLHDACGGLPSLRFAFESAIADLAAQSGKLPLARWLSANASDTIEINALIDGSDPERIADAAREKSAAGFATFKVKVGVGSFLEDARRIASLREVAPEASIRIDANAAWSEPVARDALREMSGCNLEFVEQPLSVGQLLESRRLAQDCGIALALDEEIETAADAIALIEEEMCEVVVLKPMVLGGITDSLAVVGAARRGGVGVVFTSAWESDIGLAATLHLAAAAGPVARASGLSTAGMIAERLVNQPLDIHQGHLSISERYGIGLNLHTDAIS